MESLLHLRVRRFRRVSCAFRAANNEKASLCVGQIFDNEDMEVLVKHGCRASMVRAESADRQGFLPLIVDNLAKQLGGELCENQWPCIGA